MAENQVKFGYLSYEDMFKAIQKEMLGKYNVCYTKDTKEIYLIDDDLNPIALKSKIQVYVNEESALENLRADSSTYNGQIVSIVDGDYFTAYTVYTKNDEFNIKKVFNKDDLNYDKLTNVPIKNVESTVLSPIVLANLQDGIYKINYAICPDGTRANNIVGNFIFVEGNTVKLINSSVIKNYDKANNTVDTYVTSEYVKDFVTGTQVDEKLAALNIVTQEYLAEYIKTSCEELIKQLVVKELNSRECTESEISTLFNTNSSAE